MLFFKLQASGVRWLCDNPSSWWQSRAVSNFCSCWRSTMKMLLLPLWLKTGMDGKRKFFFKKSNMSFQARLLADFWLFKCLGLAIKGLGGAAAICLPEQEVLPRKLRGCLVRETSVVSPKFFLALGYPHSHPCISFPPSLPWKYCFVCKSCEECHLLSWQVRVG